MPDVYASSLIPWAAQGEHAKFASSILAYAAAARHDTFASSIVHFTVFGQPAPRQALSPRRSMSMPLFLRLKFPPGAGQ